MNVDSTAATAAKEHFFFLGTILAISITAQPMLPTDEGHAGRAEAQVQWWIHWPSTNDQITVSGWMLGPGVS